MSHGPFEFLVLDTGPWFGHEVARGQPPSLEQGSQEQVPALAKDTDQAPACGPPPRLPQGRTQVEEGAGGNGLLGGPAHTEQPQRGHGHGQPQPRRPLGIGHARVLPLPPPACGHLEALLDPGPQAVPTGLAALGGQIGQDEPRLLVALFPAGQQGAVQAAGPAHEGGPAPLPAGARVRRNGVQRLEAVAGLGSKGPAGLEPPEGMPAQAHDAPIQPGSELRFL